MCVLLVVTKQRSCIHALVSGPQPLSPPSHSPCSLPSLPSPFDVNCLRQYVRAPPTNYRSVECNTIRSNTHPFRALYSSASLLKDHAHFLGRIWPLSGLEYKKVRAHTAAIGSKGLIKRGGGGGESNMECPLELRLLTTQHLTMITGLSRLCVGYLDDLIPLLLF